MPIHTLEIVFNFSLLPEYIYDFRGAIIALAHHKDSTLTKAERELLQNRTEDEDGKETSKTKLSYPLIHFRSNNKEACIWAVNEGVTALKKLLQPKLLKHFAINGKVCKLEVKKEKEIMDAVLQIIKKPTTYLLFHYIPIHANKKKDYYSLPTMEDKLKLIKQKITNEIQQLCQATAVNIEEKKIKINIIDIIKKGTAVYKTKTTTGKLLVLEPDSYFLKIAINMQLPQGIALGVHKAYGYGVVQVPNDQLH